MPPLIVLTLYASLLASGLFGCSICLKRHRLSMRAPLSSGLMTPDPIAGDLACIGAQLGTVYMMGLFDPIISLYIPALLGLGLWGYIGEHIPRTSRAQWLHTSAFIGGYMGLVWVSPLLQSSQIWLPIWGVCSADGTMIVGMNGLILYAVLRGMLKLNAVPHLWGMMIWPVWGILVIFFAHTAFGAGWGWPYPSLKALSAMNFGVISAFLIFNRAPSFIILRSGGICALGGGLTVIFCGLQSALLVGGLFIIPLMALGPALYQWAFQKEQSPPVNRRGDARPVLTSALTPVPSSLPSLPSPSPHYSLASQWGLTRQPSDWVCFMLWIVNSLIAAGTLHWVSQV